MSEDIIGGFFILISLGWMVFHAICLAKLAAGIPSLRDDKAENRLVIYLTICILGFILAIIAWISNDSVTSAGFALALASMVGYFVENAMFQAEVR